MNKKELNPNYLKALSLFSVYQKRHGTIFTMRMKIKYGGGRECKTEQASNNCFYLANFMSDMPWKGIANVE